MCFTKSKKKKNGFKENTTEHFKEYFFFDLICDVLFPIFIGKKKYFINHRITSNPCESNVLDKYIFLHMRSRIDSTYYYVMECFF